MDPENKNQPGTTPGQDPGTQGNYSNLHSRPNKGRIVLQPSESLKQEMQARQSAPITQPAPVVTPAPATPSPGAQPQPSPAPQQSQPIQQQPAEAQQPQTAQASLYPQPTAGHMRVGISASQMGDMPKSKRKLNPKRLIFRAIITLAVLGGIFMALVMTNIIALSEFKTMGYKSANGSRFTLDFYTKHKTRDQKTDNQQLVSKISRDGKFPILMSISTVASRPEPAGYKQTKNCASFTKAFEVQNNNLKQKIAVCDFGKRAKNVSDFVYVAGFTNGDKVHVITITQDLSSVNLSSPDSAREAVTKFGMKPYRQDLERIISSIKAK